MIVHDLDNIIPVGTSGGLGETRKRAGKFGRISATQSEFTIGIVSILQVGISNKAWKEQEPSYGATLWMKVNAEDFGGLKGTVKNATREPDSIYAYNGSLRV
jgi:hypothetical protein